MSEIGKRRKLEPDYLEHPEDQIVYELANIFSFKVTELFDEHNNLKPLVEQPAYVHKAIADVKIRLRDSGEHDADGVPIIHVLCSVKTVDKLKVLEQLGMHVGAFEK